MRDTSLDMVLNLGLSVDMLLFYFSPKCFAECRIMVTDRYQLSYILSIYGNKEQ